MYDRCFYHFNILFNFWNPSGDRSLVSSWPTVWSSRKQEHRSCGAKQNCHLVNLFIPVCYSFSLYSSLYDCFFFSSFCCSSFSLFFHFLCFMKGNIFFPPFYSSQFFFYIPPYIFIRSISPLTFSSFCTFSSFVLWTPLYPARQSPLPPVIPPHPLSCAVMSICRAGGDRSRHRDK